MHGLVWLICSYFSTGGLVCKILVEHVHGLVWLAMVCIAILVQVVCMVCSANYYRRACMVWCGRPWSVAI